MKKGLLFLIFILFIAQPCIAEDHYQIDVLQLGDTEAFDSAYSGLLDGLARQGLVKGYNLSVARYVIDTKPEDNLWARLRTWIMMSRVSSQVVKKSPDLVITLGTPATRQFQKKIRKAGIPLVYNAATHAISGLSQGATGVVISTNATDAIHASILTAPHIKTLGIIHSNNKDAISFVSEARACSKDLGLSLVTREVDWNESIIPVAKELIAFDVDAFLVPADDYYEQKGWKAEKELMTISKKYSLPCISSLPGMTQGSFLCLRPDLEMTGNLTASYVQSILVQGIPPEELPVIIQHNHSFVVDLSIAKSLGICFRPKSYDLLSMNN